MGWPGGAGYGRAVALSLSFSFTNPFHIGAVVPDLETAMEEVASGHGVTWAKVQERQQSLWTPTLGAVVTPLRFSYTCEGPLHLELLQGEAGTIWDNDVWNGLQHTGVWSTDVAGERMQHARTSDLIFPVPYLVEYLSSICTLEPGDIIFTGTPEGVGAARGRFLKEGELVESWAEGIGSLHNRCVAGV